MGILIEWEGELGHWLGNAGRGTNFILTVMTAMQNRKRNPRVETWGESTAAKGDKSGSQPKGLQKLTWSSFSARFLVEHKHLLQWSLAEPIGTLRMGRSPLPGGFVQVELLFSHRHKGQVKPDAAVSPPGLCSISKPPEQGCCCASP